MREFLQKYSFMITTLLFFVILIYTDLTSENVVNIKLKIIGIVFLFSSPIFFVPPFMLLKKFGGLYDSENYMSTTKLVKLLVYKIVRHPQYLGYIFIVLGFSLLNQTLLLSISGLFAIISVYYQSINEEKELLVKFGSEYELYMKEVPRFNFILGIIRQINKRNKNISH